MREGIGAQISIYYGSKADGPFVTGVGSPFSFARLDVPVTSDPQTTFIPGQNSVTFGALGVPAVVPGFLPGTGNGLGGFCIGLTPPNRDICSGRYCADRGLEVLTSGLSEGSFVNCNAGFEGIRPINPVSAFLPVADADTPIPGFCIEAEVAEAPFEVTPDIQYGIADNEPLLLDKYEPTFETSGLKPIAIFVHGGSCITGSRKEPAYVDLATNFASDGFVALSVSYRLKSTQSSCRTPGSIEAAGR